MDNMSNKKPPGFQEAFCCIHNFYLGGSHEKNSINMILRKKKLSTTK